MNYSSKPNIMKKFKMLFVALLSISILSLSSCNKEDDAVTPDNPLISGGSLSLKVDGTSWNASLAVVGINSNGVINVTGSDSNAHQASIILIGVTEPGTYTISTGLQHQLRWTEGLGTNESYLANGLIGSGSITVTELSSAKIKGTFQFTGANTDQITKSITEGSFEATF